MEGLQELASSTKTRAHQVQLARELLDAEELTHAARVIPIALGRRSGQEEIFVAENHTGATSDTDLIGMIGGDVINRRSLGNISVAMLDVWRENNDIVDEHIHILKIDCEGKDADVIHGALDTISSGRVDYIFWEYSQFWIQGTGDSDPPSNLRRTVELLAAYGFDSYMLGNRNALQLNGPCFDSDYETWLQSDVVSIHRHLQLNQIFLRKYNLDFF